MIIDELFAAMQEWSDAALEHDKALADYEGYSWDYHGHYVIERLEKAKKQFLVTLEKLIDKRIAEVLER